MIFTNKYLHFKIWHMNQTFRYKIDLISLFSLFIFTLLPQLYCSQSWCNRYHHYITLRLHHRASAKFFCRDMCTGRNYVSSDSQKIVQPLLSITTLKNKKRFCCFCTIYKCRELRNQEGISSNPTGLVEDMPIAALSVMLHIRLRRSGLLRRRQRSATAQALL